MVDSITIAAWGAKIDFITSNIEDEIVLIVIKGCFSIVDQKFLIDKRFVCNDSIHFIFSSERITHRVYNDVVWDCKRSSRRSFYTEIERVYAFFFHKHQ